jgi:hypothetical protein
MSPDVTVQLLDQFGNLASNSAMITLGLDDPDGNGGHLLNSPLSESAVNGIATFTAVSVDKAGSGYELVASVSGIQSVVSQSFSISPGSLHALTFTQQPVSGLAGVNLSDILVQGLDAFGNVTTNDSETITLAIQNNPVGGTLLGTTAEPMVAGVASFSAVNVNRATDSYTLRATSTGGVQVVSGSFNVEVNIEDDTVTTDNGSPTGPSSVGPQAISGDDRFVVFASDATNLSSPSGNALGQVYLRDRVLQTTTLVSLNTTGGPARLGAGGAVAISRDGSSVVFESASDDLVPAANNFHIQVFEYTVATGQIALASQDSLGNPGNGDCASELSITSDGNLIGFTSAATNFGISALDCMVRNMQTGIIQGLPGTGAPVLSADGTLALYFADPTSTGHRQIVFQAVSGVTQTVVSTDSQGNPANNDCGPPTLSDDGTIVAFPSTATNLTSGTSSGQENAFRKDLTTGTTTLISINTQGSEGNASVGNEVMSADGRFVAFQSGASDLVSGDTNGAADIFVRDTLEGRTARVDTPTLAGQSNNLSVDVTISPDGTFVVFDSFATNLTSFATTQEDVYTVQSLLAPP